MIQGSTDLVHLARTGPGTALGALFRRYWLPVLLASELPEADCPPVRVTLLSEKLIAFRDSTGNFGLLDEFCPHRGASLWFGRAEDCGIRCSYHGWKFDITGRCVEIPSEPAGSSFAERVRVKSYPLIERGGILWAYLGDPGLQPAPPAYEFVSVQASQRFASKRFQACNYLQALDGGLDPFHLAFLHRGEFAGNAKLASRGVRDFMRPDLPLRMEVAPSSGGLMLANGRVAEHGVFWRVMQWLMPTITLIPPFGDAPVHGHAWVPIDDDSCWVWTFEYHPVRPLTDGERRAGEEGGGLHVPVHPGTFLPIATRENDYFIDRRKQKDGVHYSGVPGIGVQDAALQETMAPLQTRREHLVSIDRFIVQARRRLREAAAQLASAQFAPPGVESESQEVRSASVILPRDADPFEHIAAGMRVQPGKQFVTE